MTQIETHLWYNFSTQYIQKMYYFMTYNTAQKEPADITDGFKSTYTIENSYDEPFRVQNDYLQNPNGLGKPKIYKNHQ